LPSPVLTNENIIEVFTLNIAGRNFIVDADVGTTKALFKAPDDVADPGPAVIETFGLELFVNPRAMKAKLSPILIFFVM